MTINILHDFSHDHSNLTTNERLNNDQVPITSNPNLTLGNEEFLFEVFYLIILYQNKLIKLN